MIADLQPRVQLIVGNYRRCAVELNLKHQQITIRLGSHERSVGIVIGDNGGDGCGRFGVSV